MHLVFNVDRLRPYFPPLLDTSNVAEQLTPTELNPDYMEQATTDRIMDTDQENPPAEYPAISSCQSRPTPSPGKVAHRGPSSTEVSSSHGGTQHNGDHCFLRGEE